MRGTRWRGYAAAAVTVAVLVEALRLASVENDGIAVPLLLLNVLLVARFWGAGPAIVSAVLAAAGLSYYFLPPPGFDLASPDEWFEFLTFLITAIVAGELASRAERRAFEAQQGRLEIERLYDQLQAAFDRASEAEAARRNEQLKAALLDALTHNLRTPLTAIKAAVTALISARGWTPASELSSDGRRELLQVIDEESDRLNRFIEGLSSADRRDVSQAPTLGSARIEDIVRAGVARADNLTRDHHVVVALTEPLPSVSVDPASIIEVVYMLLDNASKYSPGGTTIRVTAGLADERYVNMAVVDQGPGVPEDLRERVFENFYRVPAREPRDPRRVGIGLGLPIARRLVEAQGGRIWLESPASGPGTAAVLLLPSAAVEDPARVENVDAAVGAR